MASPNTSTSFVHVLGGISQASTGEVWTIGTIDQTLGSFYQFAAGMSEYGWVYATVDQTLTVSTQLITASSLEHLLISTVNASENIQPFLGETLESLVIPTTYFSIIVDDLYTDVVNTSNTITFDVYTYLTSTIQASESFLGSIQTTLLTSEVQVSEEIVQSITLPISSTVQISNTISISRDISLESTVQASETIDPGVIYNQLEISTALAADELMPGQAEYLTANAIASSTITDNRSVTDSLTSTVNAADVLTTWASMLEELYSTVQASESFNFEGSVYSEMLVSVVSASDWIWAKDFGAIAWVMNTQSGGVTNYDNFGFTSLAFHAGKLYATSPEGLFELDADNDAGRHINALSKSGFLDFGLEEKKRVSDIYVGYTGGELECDVETYDGPEEVYTYDMEYREADAPRNNRLKIGRGLSSRYWRLTFRNVGGADFQIHDVAVQIAKSKRRL